MKLFRFILLGTLIFWVPAAGTAQTGDAVLEDEKIAEDIGKDSVRLGRVVVTATKTEIHEAETGASVTIITGEEIEKKGKRYVVDVLKEVPGVTVSKSGNIVYIYLRGADHGNTMVLIDGMRANDPISDSKSFDFGHLVAENIERIEIIRGPQSTLYGSEASGGVINIITRKGKEKTILTVSAEAGSPKAYTESVSVSGKIKKIDYALAVSRIDRGGYSSVSEDSSKTSNLEGDEYANTTLSSKIGIILPWDFILENSLFFSYADFDIDDWAADDDLNRVDSQRNIITATTIKQSPFTVWDYALTFGYHDIKRTDEDDVDSVEPADTITDSWFHGTDMKSEWLNNFYIGKMDTITTGVEYAYESGESYSKYGAGSATEFNKNAWTVNAYAQNHLKLWDRIFVTAGMRYIFHKEFRSQLTWQTSLSCILPVIETRLRGTYGTGFKAPTLYQLYVENSYVSGDPDLKPEKSSGFEVGFDQSLLDEKIELSATYFDTRYSEMITGVEVAPWTYEYMNTGKAWTHGVETGVKMKLPHDVALMVNYTCTMSEDKSTGEELLKRPRHKASAGLDWEFAEAGNLNVTCNYIGERKESTAITLDDYYTVDVSASYWMTKWVQAFIRIENITDSDYVEYTGYTTPGISVYAGLKGRLEFGEDEVKKGGEL